MTSTSKKKGHIPRSKRPKALRPTQQSYNAESSQPPLPTLAPKLDTTAENVIQFLDKKAIFDTMIHFRYLRTGISLLFVILKWCYLAPYQEHKTLDEVVSAYHTRQKIDLAQLLINLTMVAYSIFNTRWLIPIGSSSDRTERFIQLYENPEQLDKEKNELKNDMLFVDGFTNFPLFIILINQLLTAYWAIKNSLDEPRLSLFNYYGLSLLFLIPPIIWASVAQSIEEKFYLWHNKKLFEQSHVLLKKSFEDLSTGLRTDGYNLSVSEYDVSHKERILLATLTSNEKMIQSTLIDEFEYLINENLKQGTNQISEKKLLIFISPTQSHNHEDLATIFCNRMTKRRDIELAIGNKTSQLEDIFPDRTIHTQLKREGILKLPEIYFFINFYNTEERKNYYTFLTQLYTTKNVHLTPTGVQICSTEMATITEEQSVQLQNIRAQHPSPLKIETPERSTSSESPSAQKASSVFFNPAKRRPTSPDKPTSTSTPKRGSSSSSEKNIETAIPASLQNLYSEHPNRFKMLGNTLFYFDNEALKKTTLDDNERRAMRTCFKMARDVLPKRSQYQQGIKFTGKEYELKRKGAYGQIRVHSKPTKYNDELVQIFNHVAYK